MSAGVHIVTAVVFSAALGYAELCPKAVMKQSGELPDVSWASGAQPSGKGKACTQQQVTSLSPTQPMPVHWPAAGILEAKIGGRFVSSACCADEVKTQKAVLRYGLETSKTLETFLEVGSSAESDDYPDLIEPDAKMKLTSFTGSVWDGAKFVRIDLELKASASHPHFNQSVFEFVIADRSSEPLVVEWDLVETMNREAKSFVTNNPEGTPYRLSNFVFFAKERPAPQRGEVKVKNGGGKLLGRFAADGFTGESLKHYQD